MENDLKYGYIMKSYKSVKMIGCMKIVFSFIFLYYCVSRATILSSNYDIYITKCLINALHEL